MTAPPRVRLLSRVGCHLCDEAREQLAGICAERRLELEEVDVDSDPALVREYSDDVPVVLVDGEVVGRLRVPRERVLAALDRR